MLSDRHGLDTVMKLYSGLKYLIFQNCYIFFVIWWLWFKVLPIRCQEKSKSK